MASDILLYDADIVPVGKDQKQHLEMTRDIAKSFNHKFGDTFVIPKCKIDSQVMTIPGIDGRKMSKTYDNTIDIFDKENKLKKQIMSIITDSKGIEDKKIPEQCNVFKIYSLLANNSQINNMKSKYQSGGYGYGHAKKELLELILEKFKNQRNKYFDLMKNYDHLNNVLEIGEKKAKIIAGNVLDRVRKKLGY